MKRSISDSVLHQIFSPPLDLKSVLIKKLADNDDSGRHGVVVPVESYPMFPVPDNFNPDENYTEDVTIFSFKDNQLERHECKFKRYQRYPERRLTRLPKFINERKPNSLLVLGQIADREYEIHVIEPGDKIYSKIVNEFLLQVNEKNFSSVNLNIEPKGEKRLNLIEIGSDQSIDRFLKKFDLISGKEHETLRSGSTGIGYTFETLIGLEENNFRGPDFEDIEIKCYSLAKKGAKKNLFLLEPDWEDNLGSMVKRVRSYGYDDENGRRAIYSAVTASKNSHHFKLSVFRKDKCVRLSYKDKNIALWKFEELALRLNEKLTKAVYVGASVKTKNGTDYFEYKSIIYCANPFIDSFINLIEIGQIFVELRLHINEKGSVRNHGSCFRINEPFMPDLYAAVKKLREN